MSIRIIHGENMLQKFLTSTRRNITSCRSFFRSGASVFSQDIYCNSSMFRPQVRHFSYDALYKDENLTSLVASKSMKIEAVSKDKEGLEICQDICAILAIDDVEKFHHHIACFYERSTLGMKANYGGLFNNYLTAIKNGVASARSFSRDPEEVVRVIRENYAKGYSHRFGRLICNFSNYTARASHLYGDKEQGFLYFEDVHNLITAYNRFGMSHNKDENSCFLLLTHTQTRNMIKECKLTPEAALAYAQEFDKNPRAKNPLSGVFQEVQKKNLEIQNSLIVGIGS